MGRAGWWYDTVIVDLQFHEDPLGRLAIQQAIAPDTGFIRQPKLPAALRQPKLPAALGRIPWVSQGQPINRFACTAAPGYASTPLALSPLYSAVSVTCCPSAKSGAANQRRSAAGLE